MAVNWSSEFGNNNGYGRLGINISMTHTQTQTTVKADVYYWSKWSVYDVANTFLQGFDGAANSIGSVGINTKSNSSWSNSNIVYIGSWSKTYSRKTIAYNGSFACSCSTLEYGGGSGSHSVGFTIPARNYYTITYNANGGTGEPLSQGYYYGYNIKLSSDVPTRNGYKFLGWSQNKDATTASYQPGNTWLGTNASDYTLYAVWQKMYTVTFDAMDGTVNGKIIELNSVTYGTNLTSLPVAVKEGYIFLGWNENADGNGIMYTSVMVTTDMMLYAIYEEIRSNEPGCFVKRGDAYVPALLYVKNGVTWSQGKISVKQNEIWK